jgi:hypothetical protein
MREHLGVRKKPVRTNRKKREHARKIRSRRVFKGTVFEKRRLGPITFMPELWRYMYPGAFEALPDAPMPDPALWEEAPRHLKGLEYDPRVFFNLEDFYEHLRREVINDPGWREWSANCFSWGDAIHGLFEIAPADEDAPEIIVKFFRFPPEAIVDYERDPDVFWEEWVWPYAEMLSDVITQMSPDDIEGGFGIGHDDCGNFGLLYSECDPEEEAD